MAEPNTGDTAWLLVATALVMVMLPGLAFFYGGLVRRKNVLSTIMHSFFGLAIVSVTWVLLGYTLAFGPDTGLGLIGGLDFAGFSGVTGAVDSRYAPTIPHVLFAAFQLMFAAITPALITGAFAERKRFGSFVLFTVLWSTLVYAPLAHWVWAPGGWLRTLGALDFAGGTVVHISSGVSAFVVALLIGRRAASALLVTNTAAGAATLSWVLASYLHKGKVSVIGAACGAVAGLVAITPASGFVTAGGALLIGTAAGGLCYSAPLLRERLRIDDALDVFAVHGVGGTLGAVATGVFAVAAVGGVSGAIEGNLGQVGIQLVAVAATYAFAGSATFGIVKLVDLLLGLRVSVHDEQVGLDLSQHGEAAYGS